MEIIYNTNIDVYKKKCFPILELVPRKGDYVHVTQGYEPYFTSKKLPTRLQVVDITWFEHKVICELWFSDVDYKLYGLDKRNNW
jgi:hypothetical protein